MKARPVRVFSNELVAFCQPRELAKPLSNRLSRNRFSGIGQSESGILKKQLIYPVSPTHTGFSWYNRENPRQANNWKNWRKFIFRHFRNGKTPRKSLFYR